MKLHESLLKKERFWGIDSEVLIRNTSVTRLRSAFGGGCGGGGDFFEIRRTAKYFGRGLTLFYVPEVLEKFF